MGCLGGHHRLLPYTLHGKQEELHSLWLTRLELWNLRPKYLQENYNLEKVLVFKRSFPSTVRQTSYGGWTKSLHLLGLHFPIFRIQFFPKSIFFVYLISRANWYSNFRKEKQKRRTKKYQRLKAWESFTLFQRRAQLAREVANISSS